MAGGDAAALGLLYDDMAPRVRGLALAIMGDPDEADDVAEETFWQAWRSADSYNGTRASPAGWLLMIARTRAIDRIRARRRHRNGTAAAVAGGELRDATEPAEPDFHPGLASALHDLPAEQREVIELAFLDGLSHNEIADRTTQPVGTVKTRIRLAMDKLRRRLVSSAGEAIDG
jgi:RNA polymerase sigma-70 factor (ECF subfamily)